MRIRSLTYREGIILCMAGLALECGIGLLFCRLTLSSPSFRVCEGMTCDEVDAVLGKPLRGLRPASMQDGSWTGLWSGPEGIIEVKFDSQDKVQEAPHLVRRLLSWLGCKKVLGY